MTILIISPYLPHPLAGHGGGVYLYEMVRRIAAIHDVTLISFADEHERRLAGGLSSLPVAVHIVPRRKGPVRSPGTAVTLAVTRAFQLARSLARWEPYLVSKFHNRRMSDAIRSVTSSRQFDIVQIEYAQMGQYAADVRSGATVLHEHDVILRTMHRYYAAAHSPLTKARSLFERCRWNSYEPRMVRRFTGVSTLTQPDQMLLEWWTGRSGVAVIPPGVDSPPAPALSGSRNANMLLFAGNLSQVPNDDAAVWLCSEIFPRIAAAHPAARLSIIGRSPSAALRRAANDPRITLPGFVEDLSSQFLRAGIFVAPLRLGGGMKIKILEALAHGIPVVTTPVGVEGITGVTPASARIARTAEAVARHCIELLQDPEHARAMGNQGRSLVNEEFSWTAVLERTTAYYINLLKS